VFFYELREGDDNIFADVLLVSEEEMDAESFFELVQSIRHRIQDSYEQDTLIEAIAEELERDHGFIPISDERLSASVNVSKMEDENYLASIDSDDEDDPDSPDYRGIFVDLPRNDALPN
jgi:vacuolar-type H+-ATPase subunit I/STV1